MVTVSMSKRGEIVIPKKIREKLGLKQSVTLNVKSNVIQILPTSPGNDLVKRAEARAKRLNIDPSTLVMGDDLYDEVFGEKWKHVLGR